jgi:hypothetical protein
VDDPTRGDHERFNGVKQPVHIHDNVYASGARSYGAESGAVVLGESEVSIGIVDEGGEVYLEARLPTSFDNLRLNAVSGSDLECVRFVDAEFEEPDGSAAVLATDLIGADKTGSAQWPAGPLAALTSEISRYRVW